MKSTQMQGECQIESPAITAKTVDTVWDLIQKYGGMRYKPNDNYFNLINLANQLIIFRDSTLFKKGGWFDLDPSFNNERQFIVEIMWGIRD